MEEFNKKTLIEALSTLPEHQPPQSVWEDIDHRMQEDELLSQKLLKELPVHDPPENIWNKITSNLDQGRTGKVIGIGWRRILVVAASLALLLVAYWQLQDSGELAGDNVTYTYATIEVDDKLLENNWDEDEAAFEEFKEMCKTKQYICEHPEFQVLQSELNELTDAKASIVEAMGAYGANAEFVNQITDIELERTDILKKMMAMLI